MDLFGVMIQVGMRMDVDLSFMALPIGRQTTAFWLVPMAMHVHKIIGLKQRRIIQDYIRLAGSDYSFILAEDVNDIGYLLNNMQVMSRNNNRFAGAICLNQ